MANQKPINVSLVIILLLFPPLLCYGLGLPHPDVLSVFMSIIGLWLTEALALPVTGLLVPLLAILYGALPATSAFDSFGSDVLFLFLGCFLMSKSMEKYGLDKRIAYFLLGRFMPGNSFLSINLIIALASFFLSMWISNTSATAILSAVTIGILSSLQGEIKEAQIKQRVQVRLLLSCAFAASIGGLATPVGSPPNLIALKLLAQNGINISFFEWVIIALPISLLMLLVMLVVFELLFPLRKLNFPGINQHFRKLLADLGPMKTGEKQIAVIFLLAIGLWILPGIAQSIFPEIPWVGTVNSRLSMSLVGLAGGLLTFFMPIKDGDEFSSNLSWTETRDIDWGTLMLFGGGLTLGLLLVQSGTASDLGIYLFQSELANPILLIVVVVIAAILMSEFASNTAAASILIPLILGATLARGVDVDISTTIVLAATFAASFGFMLPVSTPPNAIVYGTGRVPACDMRRAGIFFDIFGAIIIIVYMLLVRGF